MKVGLIGKELGHSFSKMIHEKITHEPYELISLSEHEFHTFMQQKDFDAINITIPYKEKVIDYCDGIDEKANAIHAVNAIKKVDGKLFATNTDFGGLMRMIEAHGFILEDKVVAICGTGGTSKTAYAVATALKAKEILVVGRNNKAPYSYEQLIAQSSRIDILINTTSVGMFPNNHEQIVDLKSFTRLQGVIDVIYNPLRTALCVQAKLLGIPAINGLEMLIGQAIEAIEFFRDIKIDASLFQQITQEIRNEKMNLVLIGMPSCGKTTIGQQIASTYGYEFVDLDEMIIKKSGMTIPQIFKEYGEEYFRELETQVSKEASLFTHHVIACGGGVIKKEENIKYLAQNGWIFFIDCDLNLLVSDDSRPLSSTPQQLNNLYEQRLPLYKKYCDSHIDSNISFEDTIQKIMHVIE